MASSTFAPCVGNLQGVKARFAGAGVRSAAPAGRAAIRVAVRASGDNKVALADKPVAVPGDFPAPYLDGTLPADYGFDPLGLLDPEGAGGFIDPNWLTYSEVIHARWAMLGAAGIIAPEILAYAGVIPQRVDEVLWFKSGVIPPTGTYDGYWTDPFSLFFIEVIAVQFAELRRWQDYRNPGSMGKQYFLGLERVLGGSGDPSYPGGQFFNLFNFGKTEGGLKEMKTKELKNGRLAMLAVFGYGAQAVLTGKGPFTNLMDHLSDPFSNNILSNFSFN